MRVEKCPDASRDLCDGGSLPREARRVDVPSMSTEGASGADDVLRVRHDASRSLSDRALELIDGPRQEAYAPPARNMTNIGRVWSAMLDLPEPIAPEQVALMLAGMKLVRASYKPGEDSLVDLVGYAEIAERLR